MEINGLKLPAYLVELMVAGRWKQPAEIDLLADIIGIRHPRNFDFLTTNHIARETQAWHWLLEQGLGDIYGITSTPMLNQRPEFLDVTLALVIAMNLDEEIIGLDYRQNIEEPVVVFSVWPTTGKDPCQWQVLANTFREFADKLGL